MNIKQASKQSGVSAPNIRFYEKEGLLDPARLPGNDYRDYTERMLDVPLPVIRSVLAGDAPLGNILREQQTALEQRAKQLEGAARFCAELARQDPSAASLDVDACLSRMEDPAPPRSRASSPAGCRITARWRRCSIRSTFSLSCRAASTRRRSLRQPCRRMQRNAGCNSA